MARDDQEFELWRREQVRRIEETCAEMDQEIWEQYWAEEDIATQGNVIFIFDWRPPEAMKKTRYRGASKYHASTTLQLGDSGQIALEATWSRDEIVLEWKVVGHDGTFTLELTFVSPDTGDLLSGPHESQGASNYWKGSAEDLGFSPTAPWLLHIAGVRA